MDGLAEKTSVTPGNVSGNQLAHASSQRAFPTQKDVDQLVDWVSGLWPKCHGPHDAGEFPAKLWNDGKLDVCHMSDNSFF
jgi:hypothetical protein